MAQLVEPVTPDTQPERRPLVERLGLGAIALLIAALFATLGYTALSGGELFLGAMAGIGAVMTVWAAVSTLRRG
jgi:hypothetical protein